ncbi:hypothetical protein ABB37_08532 [Leptomonas pyrrhocoris]|uniref:Uncharacterized protein n=1 Tax=Leptomonas pyrrhocoris TaxID=157538 RepID=A0A0M9FSQ7_LEPPY|nr:hypothetical protein ABB37_08532 [Leptomonas pyrrhocoris]KPA75217.1 hypothetical protein ABB37_08532 [Leptomonas pyrrhocoris]|eukprot:XP_015653656.1 hypothetical protein ABB37_08532 [Leptomonas pyrrhocoris]
MFASSANAATKSLRSAEQHVVRDELRSFEARHLSTAAPPPKARNASRSVLSDSTDTVPSFPPPTTAAPPPMSAAAAASVPSTRTEQTQKLMQLPFSGSAVHGERTALNEAQQVHDAVAWLCECPGSTLRQLQQRVLCATETLFTNLVGMPAAARELLVLCADPNAEKEDVKESSAQSLDAAEQAANPYITSPLSLTFADFVGTFLRDAPIATGAASFYGVLLSGRPRPAAPLSSLHLVYGLHVVEDVLRPPATSPSASPSAAAAAAPMATGLESHQALMSEVVHWAHFFESIFDKAREGLCRDPMNFYVAVLLACAERGAWDLHNTPDALAEEAVRRLRLDDGTSGRRPHICGACEAEATYLAERCRTYVSHTLRTVQHSIKGEARTPAKGNSTFTAAASCGGGGGSHRSPPRGGAQTRFFLATPAVVWWAAAFLRLYRLRTPVAATKLTAVSGSSTTTDTNAQPARTSADDVVSCTEVYFIRDWIARVAKMDEDGFAAQEREGGFVIPLSCATKTPAAVFCFTPENVKAAVRHISEWADVGAATGAPLQVQELLSFLQDDFPVVPYYFSFFASN